MEHTLDRGLGDAILTGELSLCDVAAPVSQFDLEPLHVRETATSISLTSQPRSTTLRRLVGHVVRVRAEKPVARVLAQGLITGMADAGVAGVISEVELPAEAVSEHGTALPGFVARAVPEGAVATLAIQPADPRPALIGGSTIDMQPVTFFDGEAVLGHTVMLQELGL